MALSLTGYGKMEISLQLERFHWRSCTYQAILQIRSPTIFLLMESFSWETPFSHPMLGLLAVISHLARPKHYGNLLKDYYPFLMKQNYICVMITQKNASFNTSLLLKSRKRTIFISMGKFQNKNTYCSETPATRLSTNQD